MQISYAQKDIENVKNFETLKESQVIVDDIFLENFPEKFKQLNSSFLDELANENDTLLRVKEIQYHKFYALFKKPINDSISIYGVLHYETYSSSKYVLLLLRKNQTFINLRRIYCNSEVYRPDYQKDFGSLIQGDSIKLFDMQKGFFTTIKISSNGLFYDEYDEYKDNQPLSIYNSLFDIKSSERLTKIELTQISNYKILFPLSKNKIKTYNAIPVPLGINADQCDSYFLKKVTLGKTSKYYYLIKCGLSNGETGNAVVREVYIDGKLTNIDNKN